MSRLVRFELRRTAPFLRRGVLLTAAVALVVGPVRGWDSELLWMLLFGSGFSYAVQVPAQLARDRIGGELLVLSTLPVPAGTVVAGKFGAAAIVNLAGAAQWSLATVIALHGRPLPLETAAVAAGALLWGWLALVTGSFASVALLARFDVQTLASGPVPAAVLALLAAAWLVEASVPGAWYDPGWILSWPWLPLVAGGAALLGSVLVSLLAFRTASAAIRRTGEGRHTAAGESWPGCRNPLRSSLLGREQGWPDGP